MKNKKSFLRQIKIGAVLALASFSANLFAAEIEAELRVGYGLSDNLGRTNVNPVNDDMRTAGLTLNLNEATRRITARVRSQFDFISYASDVFDEEVIGGFDGLVNLAIVEDRIDWVIEGNYGQRLFNPFRSPNPNNRETLTIWSTGPSFNLPFGDRMFARADLRYAENGYEISNFDNNTKRAQVSVGRRMRNDAELSAQVSTNTVSFTELPNASDYDINEAFIRYALQSDRTTLSFDTGYSDIATASKSGSGVVLRVNWRRVITPTSTFSLTAGSQYSNEGNIFRFTRRFTRQLGNTVDAQGRDVPYRSNTLVANYEMLRTRTQVVFSAGFISDDYQFGNAFDRDIFSGELLVRRESTRELFVRANLRVRNRNYNYIVRKDTDTILNVEFGYQFNPAFAIAVTYSLYDRSSNPPENSFTANRGFLIFKYTPPWGRQILR